MNLEITSGFAIEATANAHQTLGGLLTSLEGNVKFSHAVPCNEAISPEDHSLNIETRLYQVVWYVEYEGYLYMVYENGGLVRGTISEMDPEWEMLVLAEVVNAA